MLDVALVGTGGTVPLADRWLASTLLRIGPRLVLFDCGEGTQISLQGLGWGIRGIDAILVSHVHGDHVGGIAGVFFALANAGRTEPVLVVGPPGLREVIQALCVVVPSLPYPVLLREVDAAASFTLDDLQFSTEMGEHSVPCVAYRLDVPRAPRFLPERARALGVPLPLWGALQHGQAVTWSDGSATPDQVLGPPRRGLAVGLITDTRPLPRLARLVQGVDLLVCEGTFADPEDAPRATERKHMTFQEAAALAREAAVGRLVLTHFSAGLTDPAAYGPLAREIFPDSVVGRDHLSFRLSFPRDDA